MKVNRITVKNFEFDQKNKGTKVAIQNLIWQLSANLLKDIGVKRIHTSYKYKK